MIGEIQFLTKLHKEFYYIKVLHKKQINSYIL